MDIGNRWKSVTDQQKWNARGASFVAKLKATKAVWFPAKPQATGKKAAATAKKTTKKTAGGGRKTAKKGTGAAKKTTKKASAAKRST